MHRWPCLANPALSTHSRCPSRPPNLACSVSLTPWKLSCNSDPPPRSLVGPRGPQCHVAALARPAASLLQKSPEPGHAAPSVSPAALRLSAHSPALTVPAGSREAPPEGLFLSLLLSEFRWVNGGAEGPCVTPPSSPRAWHVLHSVDLCSHSHLPPPLPILGTSALTVPSPILLPRSPSVEVPGPGPERGGLLSAPHCQLLSCCPGPGQLAPVPLSISCHRQKPKMTGMNAWLPLLSFVPPR